MTVFNAAFSRSSKHFSFGIRKPTLANSLEPRIQLQSREIEANPYPDIFRENVTVRYQIRPFDLMIIEKGGEGTQGVSLFFLYRCADLTVDVHVSPGDRRISTSVDFQRELSSKDIRRSSTRVVGCFNRGRKEKEEKKGPRRAPAYFVLVEWSWTPSSRCRANCQRCWVMSWS